MDQVIQRRRDGTEDFNENWQDYKLGFGESDGEFWLGNEAIHSLTSRLTYVLRVDLTNGDAGAAVAEYDMFSLDTEDNKYALRLGEYRDGVSTAGKSAYLFLAPCSLFIYSMQPFLYAAPSVVNIGVCAVRNAKGA